MQQPWLTRHSTMMMKHGVMSLATSSVHAGTWLAISLHQRNTAEGETGMTETCTTSSAAKIHAVRSKTGVKSTSALNRSNVKRGTMITMVTIMNNLTNSVLLKVGAMQEESRPFPTT
jgi:hypothetical protein